MHNKKKLLQTILLLLSFSQTIAVQYLDPEQHQLAVERKQLAREDAQAAAIKKTEILESIMQPLPSEPEISYKLPIVAGAAAGGAAALMGTKLLFSYGATVGHGLWYLIQRKKDESYIDWYYDFFLKDTSDGGTQRVVRYFNYLVGAAGLYACYRIGKVAYGYTYAQKNSERVAYEKSVIENVRRASAAIIQTITFEYSELANKGIVDYHFHLGLCGCRGFAILSPLGEKDFERLGFNLGKPMTEDECMQCAAILGNATEVMIKDFYAAKSVVLATQNADKRAEQMAIGIYKKIAVDLYCFMVDGWHFYTEELKKFA